MDIQVQYRSAAGRTCRDEPAGLRGVPVEEREPLSEPRAYQGRLSKLTEWTSATTGQSVWCASTVQTDAAMLLDFDADVVCFQSRVVQLHWETDGRCGTLEPAFMARTRGGQRLAIVYPPRDTSGVEEQVMRQAAGEAGWQVRPLEVPQGVLRSSLRCAAHFRHTQITAPGARELLLKVFAAPRPLQAGAAACGLGLKAPAYAWHLVWRGELTCDWSKPLLPTSLVWASSRTAPDEER
ncbi:TnsA-like heteromeric transposase endonuclease subunit [Streptomyces sp. NBC_00658]|uniref:TnsA-like heteromeric transposase endonuclease subunit n=1 Tax=Streptomyces sp. NBC_00658 TaxID=2975800 RepID=UPI0032439E7A